MIALRSTIYLQWPAIDPHKYGYIPGLIFFGADETFTAKPFTTKIDLSIFSIMVLFLAR